MDMPQDPSPTPLMPLPTFHHARITWMPAGTSGTDPMPSIAIETFSIDRLPVILKPHQQAQVLDAFMEQTAPQTQAAVQGFAQVLQMLTYVRGRLEVGGKPIDHPDGEPVVSKGFLLAIDALMSGIEGGQPQHQRPGPAPAGGLSTPGT